jgi:hypothetical protein
MIHRARVLLLASAMLLVSCQAFTHRASSSPVEPKATARDQGYALLYSTIDDESRVDKVLILKDPSPQVVELLKAIAQFARDTSNTLEGFAKDDEALDLQNQGLPELESKTRAAISSATAKRILLSGGRKFEFRILLTQHEALNYITHLAHTLSEQETRPARKRYLAQFAKDAETLHQRVIAQLQAPYVDQRK